MVAQPAPTPSPIDQLLDQAAGYLSDDEVSAVEEAYVFASDAHAGQLRKSGGPFIEHPVSAAIYLANLRLDAAVLIAALLHDVVEDTPIAQNDISQRFGDEVAELVDGVTKLSAAEKEERRRADSPRPTSNADATARAATLRKILMTMVKDFRAVLIKFADRLHNMQTLSALREDKRRAMAQETLDFYAPLAHRLGIWEFKWRLEDLAFQHIDPEAYRAVSKMLGANRREREQYVDRVVCILEDDLRKKGIKAQVTGRPKNIYSIYRKTQRYVKMNRTVNDIYDLYALRVIVDTVDDCYAALGAVHAKWPPLSGQFDDYIANPKDNMYKSLHTAVKCEGTSPVEIQIRTIEMHHLAEYGVAAHWLYKEEEGAEVDEAYDRKMAWMRRQLLDWQRDVGGAEEYVEAAKTEILNEKIFVYTPHGDLMELPAGATPLDFAYRIHSDLGHHCVGAEVNERFVPLNYQLEMADTVHIITGNTLRGPSRDWLNENLGYLKTSHARSLVRRWFNRQERRANIRSGRESFSKEFRRLGWTISAQEVADLMGYESIEEFFAALGDGSLSMRRVRKIVLPDTEPEVDREANMELPEPILDTEILGAGDLPKRIATCCNPAPPDPIIGYNMRSRRVSVHRRICMHVTRESEKEHLVEVWWGETKALYPVRIRVKSWDRVGLLSDITSLVSDEGVNIVRSSTNPEDGISVITLDITIEGIEQLRRLLDKIEGVSDVVDVSRVPDDPPQTVSSNPVSDSPSPLSLE